MYVVVCFIYDIVLCMLSITKNYTTKSLFFVDCSIRIDMVYFSKITKIQSSEMKIGFVFVVFVNFAQCHKLTLCMPLLLYATNINKYISFFVFGQKYCYIVSHTHTNTHSCLNVPILNKTNMNVHA